MRALYSLLMRVAQPLLRRKLARRGVAEPGYLEAVQERFGYYSAAPGRGYVWLHAVSLGETRAAAVLLGELRQALPGMRLLLTHGTATGRQEGAGLLQEGDVQVWLPWDTPGAVQRFLAHFRPRVGVLMETEIWPNLVAACARVGIPLALANARMSESSARKTQRLAWLSGPAYRGLSAVWAQTQDDAQRLQSLGAPVQGIFGNIKFDAAPNEAQLQLGQRWRQSLDRPVVMFASSREGEEALLLQAIVQNQLSDKFQWLLVPRHPQRFAAVAALVEQCGLSVSRRSAWTRDPTPAQVWLGDSLGEMALYYSLSHVALLGGSFEPLGGQNLIEAAACACPVLMGPHTFNFSEAAELAMEAGAAFRVTDLDDALQRLQVMTRDPVSLPSAQAAGLRFAASHCGATHKTALAICQLIQSQSGAAS